ncbi:MAG: ATP-binding cassette domain-containing protein [Nitrospira sp.]|uniref:ABC transporter domain-containing protein n=1 Tax=Nitrospira defluvii TaxID=330214 RepID=A0ABM8S4R9_9BACT|nr:ATP-binding cassette domain-containing protein [Nitrospira defluvii]MCS6329125.1 ATP-binding cassette domain-containing protein [Nitrospira sp.]CAE6788775.1 ABC transporter domain-containing protein [Nitrospira defluvii]
MSETAISFAQVRAPLAGSTSCLQLDLQITAGQFVALVGPSRSGKSLTIELAAGLLPPQSGKVMVLGQDWSAVEEAGDGPVRLRVGAVLQQPGLLSNMTLFNNVLLPLRYHRGAMPDRQREQVVMAQLERLGLASLRDRFPAELNQGEIRRGAIARSLMLEPDVLLLDDPVAGLDADMVLVLKQYVEARRQQQPLTVVAALRSFSPFIEGADRLVVLQDGRVEADGSLESVGRTVPPALRRYVE